MKFNWITGAIFIVCFVFVFHMSFADDTCLFTETTNGGPYTFTAPVIPVTRTTSSNRIYLAYFWPGQGNFWTGNVVKLGISTDWEVVDANGVTAIQDNWAIKEDAVPFWATVNWADPGKSNFILHSNRRIYTYLGASRDLTDVTNEFKWNNAGLTEEILGNPAHTRVEIIDYIRGADVFDEDGNEDPLENRAVITGDVQHSEPLVVDYNESLTVVYFGANDGMLHAVKDSTLGAAASDDGTEMWAFIPPDQLPRLKYLVEGDAHLYFVDSSPKAYIKDVNGNGIIEVDVDSDGDGDVDNDDKDRVILVCGERKGGTSYFALDVTDPSVPLFLWRINPYDDAETGTLELMGVNGTFEDNEVLTGSLGGSATADGTQVGDLLRYASRINNFAVGEVVTGGTSGATGTIVSIANYAPDVVVPELGESWSEPRFGRVKTSDEDDDNGTAVFFIGGGYSSDNSAGKVVLAVNVLTGDVVKKFSNITGMNYCIPSSVTVVDGDSNGFVDKVYVGDLGSQMWRFGKFTDKDDNPLAFPAADENIMNWTDQVARILFLSDPLHQRRFFYPPSVTLEVGYDMIFMGTGDREDPCNLVSSDRIYAVKDSHDSLTRTESDLVDVTELTASVPDLNDATGDVDGNGRVDQGWYICLAQGEKVLAEGVVFLKTYYVTTYLPETGGMLYALNYLTGEAVLTFEEVFGPDNTGIIRSVELGRGIIPSRPVVAITDTGQKLLVPVGSKDRSDGTGPVGPGILAIEPAAPPANFFYLWWKEL